MHILFREPVPYYWSAYHWKVLGFYFTLSFNSIRTLEGGSTFSLEVWGMSLEEFGNSTSDTQLAQHVVGTGSQVHSGQGLSFLTYTTQP